LVAAARLDKFFQEVVGLAGRSGDSEGEELLGWRTSGEQIDDLGIHMMM